MKKLTTCIYFSLFLFVTGCDKQSATTSNTLEFNNSISLVTRDQSFTLKLPNNHPDKLAISSPDNVWFYLQDKSLSKQFMQEKTFIKSDTITIIPKTLIATQWIEGKETLSPVFTKNGTYSIYLSDNLETEIENSLTFIKKIELKD